MLLKPYQIIKQQLIAIEGIKLITWFNNQIKAGTLHTVPIVLIEFPEGLTPETLNRQEQQAELIIRVHLVSKLHSDKDGSVQDSLMETHEQLAQLIYNQLHGFSYEENDEQIINSLDRTTYLLDMDNPGLAISSQEFECLLYQPTVTPMYVPHEKPPPEIIPDNSREEFIDLTSPAGGEELIAGEVCTITWDQFLLHGNVKIELINEGLEMSEIINDEAYGNSFDWQIPDEITLDENYKIKISSLNNTDIFDISDEFEIGEGLPDEFITILTPNGGETWVQGENYNILWDQYLLSGNVKITLFNRTDPVLTISNNAPGTSFNWTIPVVVGYSRDYKIEIRGIDNPNVFDTSNNAFTINVPKK